MGDRDTPEILTRVPALAPPPDPLTLIHVHWDDCFTEDAWIPIVDLLARKPYSMETVGWYIGRADTMWVLASGLDAKGNAGSTWFIPETLVRSWRVVG